MKTLLAILVLCLLTPVSCYSQRSCSIQKKARELIKRQKLKGEYPAGANDTLIDLNNDHYKDILIEYYGAAGTGLKNRIQVFLYNPLQHQFKECVQLSDLVNPTFYLTKKIITGYYLANGGGYALKLKWNNYRLHTLEHIDIAVDNSIKDNPVFRLTSYNYITKRKHIKTLSVMDLPKEYKYMEYTPIIRKNGG